LIYGVTTNTVHHDKDKTYTFTPPQGWLLSNWSVWLFWCRDCYHWATS